MSNSTLFFFRMTLAVLGLLVSAKKAAGLLIGIALVL